MKTRILAINVNEAFLKRGSAWRVLLANRIAAHAPDLIVLSEVKASNLADWCSELGKHGFACPQFREPTRDDRNLVVLVLSKIETKQNDAKVHSSARIVVVSVRAVQLLLLAAYLPTSGRSDDDPGERVRRPAYKRHLWQLLLAEIQRSTEPWLLIGDLNTGTPADRPQCSRAPIGEELFEQLVACHVDLWRRHNPGKRQGTWFSNCKNRATGEKTRAPWRLDHAIASSDVAARCAACWYDHTFIAQGLTDHSAIIVDINPQTTSEQPQQPGWTLQSEADHPTLPLRR